MEIGQYVEVKEAHGAGNWKWTGRHGHVTRIDKHCVEVRTDDGELIRDVREHVRSAHP